MVRIEKGHVLVVGLGISGRAIARHLHRLGIAFSVADTRPAPAGLDAFRASYPGVAVHCGALTALDMSEVEEIALSPGVDPRTPGLEHVQNRIVGEIELFVRALRQRERPAALVAITGSNAKSTVTTLVGEMAQASGVNVAVGGNLGTPALALLEQPDIECFVLELSSFQLETTAWLGADVACYLNLSEDHLDRHAGMLAYGAAKQRIFSGARFAIINGDDGRTWPLDTFAGDVVRFTLQPPMHGEWGVVVHDDSERYLMHGEAVFMPVREMRLQGLHNMANALAALAIGTAMDWSRAAMRRVLTQFAGLPHRAEFVTERHGVRWINDSKGTNVGATLAAIEGLGPTLPGKLILLAGGLGKGADFTPLAAPLGRYAREAVLYGTDADRIARAIEHDVRVHRVDTLEQAMHYAQSIASAGDCVLLSPACASLDQFSNYEARGEAFRAWLQEDEGPA